MISQGEVWWAEVPDYAGSAAKSRLPVIIVQGDAINRSRLATTVCIPLTRDLAWADAPGSVQLAPEATGLPNESVAVAAEVRPLDKDMLVERAGKLSGDSLQLVLAGMDVMLGR